MVKNYNDSYYSQLQNWCEDRGFDAPDKEMLSDIGFIIPDVCVGFLYLTNSKVCYLETILSNPNSSDALRDSSIDLIVEALIQKATILNYKLILSVTKLDCIVKRALEHGFTTSSKQTLLIKVIE